MRALTLKPGTQDSVALEEIEPPATNGRLLRARTLALGVCGTDRDIVAGEYGWSAPGRERLVLGHECLAEVLEAPRGCGFQPGDLVAGIVRRPDPLPCPSCAAGEWDMCRNGLYTECGIKERDGFGSELIALEPDFAVPVSRPLGVLGVLVEPASVMAKAWEQVCRIGARSAAWHPRTALVTGAGPVGLLAALIARLHGMETHVYDRVTDGPKPDLVRDLGAVYHAPDIDGLDGIKPDVVLECTGAASVVLEVLDRTAPVGVVCLAGVSSGRREIRFDVALMNRRMVLENDLVFGSVNANRRHYELAARCLAAADPSWLGRLITRRVPLERWRDALAPRADDVKVVIDFAA
jgi:threonine dehydrogenase-like Zn-dependent dehydrogenase